jgi:hypothetical protein
VSARGAAVRTTAPRTSTHRTGTHRTSTHRTSPHRTSTSRTSTARTTTARTELRVVESVPVRTRPRLAQGERRAPFVLLVVAMLVGTTLGLLFLTTAIAVDSLKASELRAQNAELAEDVQALQQQVVDHDTPAALAAAATAAGLVPAGSAAYLVIAPDGSSTLRGSVTPAGGVPANED